jgi:signal transduction histidine kinase
MRAWRSIRGGLTVVFTLFLVQISLLGAFAISELEAVDRSSVEIRERWLQSTRVLGDLNNFTSDARAAEADRLLALNRAQIAAAEAELLTLRGEIARSMSAYGRIPHGDAENRIYERFVSGWNAYEALAGQVLALARANRSAAGTNVYMTRSRQAYDAASDDLGRLTNLTVVRAAEASDLATRTYQAARTVIVLVIGVAALSLLGAVNYITRVISGPLLALAARMRSLAVGETNADISGARRADEIGEMARALLVFRANAIDLAHSRVGLVQQATMLEEKLDAEQRLNALQRNFMSMASHEFRTPLTIIDAHAQRMVTLSDSLDPSEIVRRAGRIRGTVKGMIELMERLLNAARLFDGDPSLYFHPAPLDPAELLRHVCRLHREIAVGARIVEHLQGLPAAMVGDRNLLLQAFGNLVSNAVKYSPHGGLVNVSARVDGAWLVVAVEDHGLGIPKIDRGRVFDRYHRATNVTGIVGSGVGLYLVKMVVDLHDGEIFVESEEGIGSRFVIRIPLGAPHPGS